MSLESWTAVQVTPVCKAPNYKEAYKTAIPLLLQWVSTLPVPANGAISMLYYDVFMGPAIAAIFVPGLVFDPIPVYPLPPVPGPVAAAGLALQIYKDEVKLSSAVTDNRKVIKAVLIREFGPLLTDLEQGDSGLSRRTEMEIFTAAHATLGVLTSSDSLHLRDLTRTNFEEGKLVVAEIKRLKGRHVKLATIGAEYAAGLQDKLHEATNLISESNPAAKKMVDLYLVETDIGARSFDSLTAFVVERLERLAAPEYVTLRTLGFVPNHTAAAAGISGKAPPALTTGQVPSHAELLSFYEAAPIAKYCFVHGYCMHFGKTCSTIVDPQTKVLIAPYTTQHQDATKPSKLSGLDGSTKQLKGIRIPH